MRRVILAICATAAALALLLSFKTHTQPGTGTSPAAALGTPAPGTGDTAATTAPSPSASAVKAKSSTSKGTPKASTGSTTAKTVTGEAWPTIYGPVQVQVTVSGGKVTAVTATEYPQETPRDYQINSYAIPQLNSEATAAGSASIDSVSGATYTSQGYIGSLQSALDKLKG
ncbi:MAG TPA: FMN-binding protein [Actinocrinis sp.]|nr:FMN-binding protein [Actinocrinis sp.]